MYDGDFFDDAVSHHMLQYDTGMNGMYAMDCQTLGWLAQTLASVETDPQVKQYYLTSLNTLNKRYESVSAAINANLWDSDNNIYVNVRYYTQNSSHVFSYHLAPQAFYPMMAGVATPDQVSDLINLHLANPDEFCVTDDVNCYVGGSSVPRNDPHFGEQNYWRGRIWGPQVQLLWWALNHPNYANISEVQDAIWTFAQQGTNLIQKECKANHDNKTNSCLSSLFSRI